MNKVLTIASNVVFVKGFSMNLIIDLQNDCWYHVDFSLEKDDDIQMVSEENLNFMLEQGMIIQVPDVVRKRLKVLDKNYYAPNSLENVIIDRDEGSGYSMEKVTHFLNQVRNKFLQIRWFNGFNLNDLNTVLHSTEFSACESIDLLIPYTKEYRGIIAMKKQYPKISNIVFHSVNESIPSDVLELREVFFTPEKITSSGSCGKISPYNFSQNQTHVLKAMNYNTCLYKKLGVDVEGNLKNCPAMSQTLGHVDELENYTLYDFETPSWYITKDQVEVCKDCEFRYICTDCRAITDDPANPLSRPSNCEYNPYLAKWKGEEGYVPVNEYKEEVIL